MLILRLIYKILLILYTIMPILSELFLIFAAEIVPISQLIFYFMDYFIIYPRDHQFAIQRSDGFILKFFDGVTYTTVKKFFDDFLSRRSVVQLSLNF